MAWFKSEDSSKIPAELQNLTPEQIVEKIKAAEAATSKVTELETRMAEKDTALSTVQTEHEKIKAKLQELEAGPVRRQSIESDEEVTFFSDPEKAVQRHTAPITAIAIHSGKIAARLQATQLMSSKDKAVFRKYEKEVSDIVDKLAPMQQIMPENWQYALTQVKGLHLDEILKAQQDGTDFFSEVPENRVEPPPRTQDNIGTTKIGEFGSEADIARKLGVKPEDYVKQRKGMVIVNG